MLANQSSPITFATTTVHTALAWRHRCSWKGLATAYLLALTAAITYVAFALAGLFLSRIATIGDVLVQDSDCGVFNYTEIMEANATASLAFVRADDVWGAGVFSQSLQYAR